MAEVLNRDNFEPGALSTLDEPLLGVARYTKVKRLGGGSFGVVELAKDNKTGEQVAIKCIKPKSSNPSHYKYILGEVLNHRRLQHPFVVRFKELFTTEHHICIVMEYANKGSLEDHVRQSGCFSETASRYIFQQLIMGVEYCHCMGVVNRDIKLNNTLVTDIGQQPMGAPFCVKIADFGYSKACMNSDPKTMVGTVACMAPEVLTCVNTAAYDGKKADIWSCGVLLYSMLFGQLPFPPDPNAANDKQRRQSIQRNIIEGRWSIPDHVVIKGTPVPVRLSTPCTNMLQQLLQSDPQQRISIQEIYQHPWFLRRLDQQPWKPDFLSRYLGHEDYTGMQAEDDIKHILGTAWDQWHRQHILQHPPDYEDDRTGDDDIDVNSQLSPSKEGLQVATAWF